MYSEPKNPCADLAGLGTVLALPVRGTCWMQPDPLLLDVTFVECAAAATLDEVAFRISFADTVGASCRCAHLVLVGSVFTAPSGIIPALGATIDALRVGVA